MNRIAIAAAVTCLALAATAGAEERSREAEMRKTWAAFDLDDLEARRAEGGRPWLGFFEAPGLTTGLYVLPAGGIDRQSPHRSDEIYYVVRGRAVLSVDGDEQPVKAGSIVYVAAGVEHRFHSIEEELQVLVVFAGEE